MKKLISTLGLVAIFCFYSTNVLKAQDIKVGYGWSVDNNEIKAVKEAVNMMKKGVKKPELVILYSTVGYDVKSVQRDLRKELGKSAGIYGLTSCWGVISRDGIHVGKKGSLAILGLESPALDFGISGRETETSQDARRKARESFNEAILKAGKPKGSRPDIVIMTASPGIEEAVLKGIEDVVGNNVPIYGGAAADNTITGKWKVFNNNELYSSGFSLVTIFSNLKIGYAFHSGYLGSEKDGIATKVKNKEGRVLLEIDG